MSRNKKTNADDRREPRTRSKWILELVVVFLGVTAGFLLNSWREQKQERSLEEKYLTRFLEDTENNIIDLEKTIRKDSLWITRARPVLLAMKAHFFPDTMETILKMIIRVSRIDLQNSTYEDISSSGNLNIIRNFELKRKITQYQVEIEGVRFIEDSFLKYFNEFVMPFLISEYDLLNDRFLHPGKTDKIRFANIFTGYYSLLLQREEAYRKLLEKSFSLQEELERSLE